MPNIQLPNIRLYYDEHGEGPAILCIHGTGGGIYGWVEAVPTLAGLGRVICYDRRGNGKSERPEPYPSTTLEEQADDAAALLKALSATPAIVIGRSYGGSVAMFLAVRQPNLVRALVLLEPAVPGFSADMDRFIQSHREEVLEAVARSGVQVAGEVHIRSVLYDAGWEALPQAFKDQMRANSPAILAEMTQPFEARREYVLGLGAIRQPTLVVAARSSPPGFREVADGLRSTIPNAQLLLVEGGHLIDPAHPGVVRFLEEVLAATPSR